LFDLFMNEYGKHYPTQHEQEYRFKIFVANLLQMEAMITRYNLTYD
jgi:hypothetical protein